MKRTIFPLILPVLVLALTVNTAGKSENGLDIKVMIKGRMQRTEARGIVRGKPDHIWKVLTDFDSHEEFMPNVIESSVLESNGKKMKVSKTLKVALKKIPYTVLVTVKKPNHKFTWHQYDGPFEINSGSWTLENAGPNTRLIYVSEVEPRFYIPGWVKTTMVNKTIPTLFQAIESETLRRNGNTTGNTP